MELIVVVGLLVAFALAAMHWSADTRPRLSSREDEQAALGLGWRGRRDVAWRGELREDSALRIALRARRSAARARVAELDRVA